MVGQYFSDNIVICNASLSGDELNALYELTDFYLCTSHAEGQNFPLQEAMALGVVPISVRHTAMADYITTGNAIVLESEAQALPPSVARKYALSGARWFCARPFNVYEGLNRAFNLPPGDYERLSASAAGAIAEHFSASAIWSKMRAALQ